MIFADTYLQPDAPDPVLEEQAILEAARHHVPDVGTLLEIDESGGEARAYILDGDVVMKTQRPHRLRPRTSLSKEARFLQALEREDHLPVPRVLGYGYVRGIEYLCITRVAGTAMRHVELTPAQRATALKALGRTLRRIHHIDQTALASSGLLPGDGTGADLRVRFADTFQRLAGALDHTAETDTRSRPDDAPSLDVRTIAASRLARTPL